jgi:hypothetical protein
MSGIEARAARRIPIHHRVNLLVQGRVILAAMAVDISLGGVYLSAAQTLPVGSPCDVAIYLPEGEAMESLTAPGRVVRTAGDGLAIQFSRMLGDRTLDPFAHPALSGGSLAEAYVNYFKVSQSAAGYDCERIFGVSKRTFRAISTTTFVASIPTAILPVWFLRAYIPPAPNWEKILGCFVYAGIWLLALQPLVDLAVLRVFRRRTEGAKG